MNSIEKLIAEKCPDGVEYKKLEEALDYEQPTKYIVSSTEYDDSYDIPVLTAGQSFILGYTDEISGIYDASKDNPVIIFDDFTTSFHWVDFPFKVKSSAMKMLKPKDVKNIDFKYTYYAMTTLKYVPSEHSRQWIGTYSQFEIPVPPIEVQQEIVRILDKFTELEAKLSEELETRKKQYEYYLNSYFESNQNNLVPLNEIGSLTRGKRFVHADAVDDGVPCIHYGELYTYYGVYTKDVRSHIREDLRPKMRYANKGDVIIVGAGENNIDIGVGVAYDGDEPVAVHDACYTLVHKQNSKYISYYLRSAFYHNQIKKYVSEGKICSISAEGVGRALVPIPSIEEQERIVAIFDIFDAICNDKYNGLQAEIESRHIQYIYYRDKLLNFNNGVNA